MTNEEMLYEAFSLGYDGDSVDDVHTMADLFKVSDEFRSELVKAYENGYEDH